MKTAMIRPGVMVSLKSTVQGGVAYVRTDLDASEEAEAADEGKKVERWETKKVVENEAEHERATKARNGALALIRKECSATAFGLLCPEAREAELDQAIQRAKAIVAEHNETAQFTRVYIFALKGRIASSDEEAARAIGEEVRTLIESMSGSIDKLDPKGIREAATKAKEMAAMLAPEQAEKVSLAIEQARKAARQITDRIVKKSEDAATVLDDIARGAIEKARIAFLDFDTEVVHANGKALPSVDTGRFSQGLDLAVGEGN